MIARSIFGLLVLGCSLAAAQNTSRISGVVRDLSGSGLPGVTVRLDGIPERAPVVTDDRGAFELVGLKPGRHAVRASLAGFRDEVAEVVVDGVIVPTVTLSLRIGILEEVMHVAGTPHDAYRDADVIAHVRVERLQPPGPCRHLVTAFFDATTLRTFKGELPASFTLAQDSAGTCFDGPRVLQGAGSRPYPEGLELVVFLRQSPAGYYDRIAGGAYAFEVHRGSVYTAGRLGPELEMSLEAFAAALAKLAGH